MRIVIDEISKRYGASIALDRISLEMEPGQIVAVLGPNGAGKTTLLRCLAGITAPDKGAIYYDQDRFRRDRIDLRRRFSFLPDFPIVYPEMSVVRHISMVLSLYETATDGLEDRVIELLQEFDMLSAAESPMGALSRGQTYKAALVALLVADPELWMFDEPFASGMDPRGITAFKRQARAAARRGRTIIYTTQILDVAEAFSDHVCIIHQGQIHAFDSVERLRVETRGVTVGVLEEIFERLHENSR